MFLCYLFTVPPLLLKLGIEPRIPDVMPYPGDFPVLLCRKKGCY